MPGVTHGHTRGYKTSPEWVAWSHMKDRCFNPNTMYWEDYGGRGITVATEWRDSFATFFEHIGPRPSDKHSLDRIDNNGNYEPGNVRWSTRSEQMRNRRNNRMLTYQGKMHCMKKWAEIIDIPYRTLFARLSDGWSVERALTTPLKIIGSTRRRSEAYEITGNRRACLV